MATILTIMRTASEVNQMTAAELQRFVTFLSPGAGEALSNYIAFSLQDEQTTDIEVQEPVC